jgi:prevent-host-death family protein
MSVKFSEDVVPLTDLKINPGRVVRHAADAHRPVLLTSRGRAVAVVQSVSDFEKAEEERAFILDSAVEPRSTRRARRFSKRWLQCCGHLLGEIDGFTKRQLRIVFLRVPSCTSW